MSYQRRDLAAWENNAPQETLPAVPSLTEQVGSDVKQVAASVVSNPASLILPALGAIALYWAFLSKRKPVSRMLGFAKAGKKKGK